MKMEKLKREIKISRKRKYIIHQEGQELVISLIILCFSFLCFLRSPSSTFTMSTLTIWWSEVPFDEKTEYDPGTNTYGKPRDPKM